jgi:hypothetical protein
VTGRSPWARGCWWVRCSVPWRFRRSRPLSPGVVGCCTTAGWSAGSARSRCWCPCW